MVVCIRSINYCGFKLCRSNTLLIFRVNFIGGVNMENLIKQAEQLTKDIRSKRKRIDNPNLYLSTISALEFFVENVGSDDE